MTKKIEEPITTLGDYEKLTVQKSFPLYELWRSDYGLAEFKILDTYLGRIDSHNPEARTVKFERGDLEKLLEVKRIRIEDLDKRLKTLCTPIRINNIIKDEDGKAKVIKKFVRLSLFEKAVAEQDENGLWQVELTCTESAVKYFFNIDNIGYLRYKLRCITALNSRYTYIMFLYLEANRKRKMWDIDIEELKYLLNCDKETYQEYKRLNEKILKRVKKEIDEKTDCIYSYRPIKKGRKTTAIRFAVIDNPKEIKPKNEENKSASELDQRSLPSSEEKKVDEKDVVEVIEKPEEIWVSPLKNYNLTEGEINLIRVRLNSCPDGLLAQYLEDENITLRRYHYMLYIVAKIESRKKEKPIKNYCNYIETMIKTHIIKYNEKLEELKRLENVEPVYDRIPKLGEEED